MADNPDYDRWKAEVLALLFSKYGLEENDIENWWLENRWCHSPGDDPDTPAEVVDFFGNKYGLTARTDFTITQANRTMARYNRD